jgi:hypothetical protein
VEKDFNEMKWTLIAETIKQEGGDLYTVSCIPIRATWPSVQEALLIRHQPDNLQRQYKKLMVKEGLRPPPGIVDADFKIVISEDRDEGIDDDDDSE